MQYRPFGKQNFRCSEIGFGAWAIGGAWGAQADSDSLAALHRALDLGVNFIDTAAGYGNGRSERLIGQVLRERAAAGKKENIFVPPKPRRHPASGRPPLTVALRNVTQRTIFARILLPGSQRSALIASICSSFTPGPVPGIAIPPLSKFSASYNTRA